MPKDVNAIDLSTVKLCFQVFLKDERKNFKIVPPVTSQPIYDKSKFEHHLLIRINVCFIWPPGKCCLPFERKCTSILTYFVEKMS